jgi:hypothetical protein
VLLSAYISERGTGPLFHGIAYIHAIYVVVQDRRDDMAVSLTIWSRGQNHKKRYHNMGCTEYGVQPTVLQI